ncbi:MAG TPA: hypothetical protein VNO54_00805, partial [Streptosporangiaceae bacterium]|nr:hypothetical protein [Streptosporangiaceae bacterium]
FDDPTDVVRMETAFSPYEGAHAEQSAFTRELIEETIAEYDSAHTAPPGAGTAGHGPSTFTPNESPG